MSRIQLALNVSDLPAAVGFYRKLFRTEPAKLEEGYANFVIDEPPLKLVLMAGQGVPATLNHLGVEVSSAQEVAAEAGRLKDLGLPVSESGRVACCFALQDKFWTRDPDGAPWEVYTVIEHLQESPLATQGCC